jgi:hypothetical protein
VKHKSGVAAAIACGAFSAMLVTLPALADPTPSPSHQAQVEQHSKEVMPFDLNRTMHIFTPTNNGGVQIVMVHDGDPQQIALVRSHLRKEARAFARGDFRDPAAIHGNNMAGLSQLRAGAKRIAISYGATSNGASITYKTSDPSLIAAIHRWFAAQVYDHGAHAMMAH